MGILSKSIYCLSFIFGYLFFVRIQEIKSRLITYSVERQLKEKGKNLTISYPFLLSGAKYISIGDNVVIGSNSRISAVTVYENKTFTPLIKIGNNVVINRGFQIAALSQIDIKDNVLIAENVYISDLTHGSSDYEDIETPPAKRNLSSKGQILIEENVWLGRNVSVLPNVIIGRNSIIGANSVVTHDIPPYSIAVGSPARVIKKIKSK
ncbi:acetyltransferase [Bacteroidia bacterium]|nr:acetyltransferase [Bacteroidia bacterium]GHT85930.1 acetyltransferase [Bacteroidia bacterium]GHU82959.1 acetyltransferase [Bacteroidia bacterium]